MAKINYKDKRTQRANQQGLCLVTCIGLLAVVARWDYSTPVKAEPIVIPEVVEKHTPYETVYATDIFVEKDFECLVLNSYYEARNQNEDAIMAVAMVTLNRTQDSRYPSTICEVIKQTKYDRLGRILLNQCQFSWYCDGKSDRPKDRKAYKYVQYITEKAIVLWYTNQDITKGATHYHARYVKPDWASSLAYIDDIGDHRFYKWN
jgi:spore germination cell wall hydrolase CwlJ-like protein